MVEKKRLYVIWYAALGTGLSGGDNILIELTKRWLFKLDVSILTGIEGELAYKKKSQLFPRIWRVKDKRPKYLYRFWIALKTAFMWNDPDCIIYTSSDFWHDLLVGLIVKMRFPSVKWIAGYYLVICPPFARNSPYKRLNRLKGIIYWLSQKITIPLVNKYADKVFVTSDPEKKWFKRPFVVKGGVNIPVLNLKQEKEWDMVFMGRLHCQKGIPELIKIYKKVKELMPDFKMLVIGDGPLYHLIPEEVDWIPFADDKDKDSIFRRSRIIIHPATYDSGGMSCAEGMAYGLPALGFNLPVFHSYYPRGMIKLINADAFVPVIIDLLNDEDYYKRMSKEARDLMVNEWDWNKKAEEILKEVI